MDYKKLGDRIREERSKLKLSQSQLAEEIDISDSYMGYIERGERGLSLDTLIKLSNRFGVSVDYLLQDSVETSDDAYVEQFKLLIDKKSSSQKQMAIEVLKTMYLYLNDDEKK